MKTHLWLMFFYAFATAAFFALLWRHDRRDRVRLFLLVFCCLFFGAIALGWAMFPVAQ